MRLNVMITASGSSVAKGIIKSVKLSSLDCNIITTDHTPFAAGLYTGKAGYIVPLAKEDGFIDSIIRICQDESVDVVLIGTDYELKKFALGKDTIESKTDAFVMVSDKKTVDIADDKWLTHKFLEGTLLPTIPSSLEDGAWDLVEKVGYPLIVKPRIGDSSKKTNIVNSSTELERALEEAQSDDNPYSDKGLGPIVQKYAGEENEEFTSTTVTLDGNCAGVLSMKRKMRFGGHTSVAMVQENPGIDRIIKEAAERLSPLGPCNFQSRVIGGVPYIFEINCRFSGTTPFCAEIGFNTVEASLRHYVLETEIQELKFRRGVFLRYFNEMFVPQETIDAMERDGSVHDPDAFHNTAF